MQTESPTSAQFAEVYDSRPWLRQYPPDVPASIDYPRQSIWKSLEETVLSVDEGRW